MSSKNEMQAVILSDFGTLMTLDTIVRPVAGPGEVLVRVKASGINPLDIKIAAGMAGHAKTVLPAILGMDFAGVVAELGAGVSEFNVGDEVYGMAGGIGAVPGSLAQFAAVDAQLLARMPANISMRQAAALPLVFITAWEGLVDRAGLNGGNTVLIHGGAGGVGHIAVQIAVAAGARVFATGTREQKDIIESYGATAIDYVNTPVEDYVEKYTGGEGFDIIYDTVGGATLDASFRAVKKYHGHVVSCLGWGTHALAPLSFRAATYSGVFTLLPLITGKGRSHHGAIMREATRLVEAGKVNVNLHPNTYSLSSFATAHDLVGQGRAEGKVVVDIDD